MMGVKQIKAVRMLRQAGHPIKEICRKTGISRNTIRKILRGKQAKFTYQREESNQPAQEPIKEVIESWIKHDSLEGKKYRRTAKRMHNELGSGKYGYSGSYSSVLRCFNEVREKVNKDPAEVFIPLDFGRGAAAQFDWGEVKAVIDGQLTILNLGAMQLSHSRNSYGRAYPSQKQELLFDVHRRAFDYFGGVPRRVIYDNLKTAVKKILKGNHRNLQERFVEFSSLYLYEADFCNPARGNEKGRIENLIGFIRENFFVPIPKYASLDELNDRLLSFLISVARTKMHPSITDKTRYAVYEEEKGSLIPLPMHGYECCRVTHAAVTSYSTIHFETNQYSVPGKYVGKTVQVKGYADEVVISFEGTEISRHRRLYSFKQHSLNPYHYLEALSRKPRAFADGLPFKEWQLPEVFQQYRRMLKEKFEDGDRYFVKTLLLVKDWPILDVAEAIRQAIAANALGDSYVLMILRRMCDPEYDQGVIDIGADLDQYKAKQPPLSRYDEVLFKRQKEVSVA
jgi:transposase